MKVLLSFAATGWGLVLPPLPIQIKRGTNGSQGRENLLLIFTANQIPREKPESPQTEEGNRDKIHFQILKQNQTLRLREYPLRGILVFSSFSQVPNSFKTPHSYLEVRIHDSKTEMDFSSSF